MTYYPLIPQAGDIPSQSQAQILSNFTEIDTDFGKDHVALTDATVANRGFHKYSRYQLQATGPATTVNQVALYCKNDGVAPNLYFRRSNIPAGGAEIVMTANVTPVNATTGQSFLPGGIIMKWGQFTMVGSPYVYTYPVGIGAFPTATLCVLVSPFLGAPPAVIPVVTAWNNLSFTVAANPGQALTYIAIGS
jgi:hypothetical protein